MKKVRDNTRVPRKPWKYTNPEDGTVLQSPYYNVLKGKVKDYRRANNYPIGLLFDDQFDEILCAHQPEACVEFTPPSVIEKMGAVTKALFKASRDWRNPVVSAEELERRRAICADCNYFGGFKSLVKLACRKCGCSGLKLALPSSKCPHENPRW